MLRVGLAQARFPKSVEDGVEQVQRFLQQAKEQVCDIVCFPEAYLPGMREQGFEVPAHDQRVQERTLEAVRQAAEDNGVAVVIGMEWETEIGLHNVAFVISENGEVLGYQTKNQMAIEEERLFVPDGKRKVFKVKGIPFGIAICHEGWRYPETVRWAAVRGAKIVFHPHVTVSVDNPQVLKEWGHPSSPYYEKAMVCRSVENSIYFASVNYAMEHQESATSLISPVGECLAYVPYGEEGLLVQDIDLDEASLLCAKRYNPALYAE